MSKPKSGNSKGGNTNRPNYPANKPSTNDNKSGGKRSNDTSGKGGKGKGK